MRRFWLYLGIATVIGGLFLWLAARELPWEDVGAWAETADAGHIAMWSLIFVLTYAICHATRVVRWYELVRPLGDVETGKVHRVCIVGFAAILLLPFRLGELVRPYLLSRRSELSMSAVLGTAVVERVVDGLIVTGLLFATLATYDGPGSPAFARTLGLISALIFVPALLVCLFALWRREFTVSVVTRIGGVVSAKLTARAVDILETFIDGFRGLAAGRALARFLFATVIFWGTNIVSVWLFAKWGFGFDINPWETATVIAVLIVGIMIPAGPGMAGNFEYFFVRGLGLFVVLEGVVGVRAGAFAALVHILQFAVITIPGFIVMWSDPEARHLVRLSSEAERAVTPADESVQNS